MGSLHKNIQLLMKFFKVPFLVLHFSYYINDLPDDVICNTDIHADDTNLYSKCDQVSDSWQQLEQNWLLNFNLIHQTLCTWVGSCLLISILEKLKLEKLVSSDQSNNTGVNDVKMNGSALKKKSSFNMLLGLIFSSNLD